ncbi:DUF642 domain-containing protein [Streptomyces sp. NPDC006658]|uniref:DUF642 domain-containing protein n=1 Tax=Streptomyces sp. NPDC006658 TaxID=3156900 RepID=UPI0033F3B296
MKHTATACLLAATALLVTVTPLPAHGTAAVTEPSVRNGTFTDPTAPAGTYLRVTGDSSRSPAHWSLTRDDIDLYSSSLARLDDAQSADLTGSHNGAISQSVATTAGQTYELTWRDAPDTWPGAPQDPTGSDPEKQSCADKNADDQPYQLVIGDTRAITYRPSGTGHQPVWTLRSRQFTAREDDTVLRFISQSSTETLAHCGPQITQVSLHPGTVPRQATSS